jgi:hypothetical protein
MCLVNTINLTRSETQAASIREMLMNSGTDLMTNSPPEEGYDFKGTVCFSEFKIFCISETHNNYNDGHSSVFVKSNPSPMKNKPALCSLMSNEMRFHLVGMQAPYAIRVSCALLKWQRQDYLIL